MCRARRAPSLLHGLEVRSVRLRLPGRVDRAERPRVVEGLQGRHGRVQPEHLVQLEERALRDADVRPHRVVVGIAGRHDRRSRRRPRPGARGAPARRPRTARRRTRTASTAARTRRARPARRRPRPPSGTNAGRTRRHAGSRGTRTPCAAPRRDRGPFVLPRFMAFPSSSHRVERRVQDQGDQVREPPRHRLVVLCAAGSDGRLSSSPSTASRCAAVERPEDAGAWPAPTSCPWLSGSGDGGATLSGGRTELSPATSARPATCACSSGRAFRPPTATPPPRRGSRSAATRPAALARGPSIIQYRPWMPVRPVRVRPSRPGCAASPPASSIGRRIFAPIEAANSARAEQLTQHRDDGRVLGEVGLRERRPATAAGRPARTACTASARRARPWLDGRQVLRYDEADRRSPLAAARLFVENQPMTCTGPDVVVVLAVAEVRRCPSPRRSPS